MSQFLSEENEKKLQDIFSSYQKKIALDEQRFISDILGRKGFFTYLLKPYFSPIQGIPEEVFEKSASAILNNLQGIKRYDFLDTFINSLYSILHIYFSVESPAELEIFAIIKNEETIQKIYKDGFKKVYKDEAKKVYKSIKDYQGLQLEEYLKSFVLFGVKIIDIQTIDSDYILDVDVKKVYKDRYTKTYKDGVKKVYKRFFKIN